jgi:hypothetical protein
MLLLSPLLLEPGGKGTFATALLSTGVSGLFALGAWRFVRFVRTQLRLGRRRSLKTQGKIIDRHVDVVYESGGKLAQWVMTVSYSAGKKKKGEIEWIPDGAFTNMTSVLDRVERRNPIGKEVPVHVDPDDPSNARVGGRMSALIYPGLALGAVALTLSLAAFVPLSLLFLATSLRTLWRWLT